MDKKKCSIEFDKDDESQKELLESEGEKVRRRGRPKKSAAESAEREDTKVLKGADDYPHPIITILFKIVASQI